MGRIRKTKGFFVLLFFVVVYSVLLSKELFGLTRDNSSQQFEFASTRTSKKDFCVKGGEAKESARCEALRKQILRVTGALVTHISSL